MSGLAVGVIWAILGLTQHTKAAEINAAFARARRELVSGVLHLRINFETAYPRPLKMKSERRIWFTPERYRCDEITDGGNGASREIFCENCEKDGYYAYFNEKFLSKDSNVTPLQIQTLKLPKNSGMRGQNLKFDVRIIAANTSSWGVYHSLKFSMLVGRTDVNVLTVKSVKWKDRDAWEVASRLKKTGALIRTLYVPGMNHCIVYAELDLTHAKTKRVTRIIMEAEPKLWGGKHWFPAKVLRKHFIDGRQVETSTLEILDASFNMPISQSEFKLIGMDIPPETGVQLFYPGVTGRHYWDGQKIVPDKRKGHETYQDKPPPGSDSNWGFWLYAGSIGCAVLAAGFLGFYFYNRMKTKG